MAKIMWVEWTVSALYQWQDHGRQKQHDEVNDISGNVAKDDDTFVEYGGKTFHISS